jgi:signal transduction histidine kinase
MRTHWFVGLRWWVPPAIAVGVALASWLGFHVERLSLLAVAAFILAYNTVFYLSRDRVRPPEGWRVNSLHRYAMFQVALDYAAMFAMVHLSGGVTSPLMFFAIFHIIFAAILLPPRYAYSFAGVVTLGMGMVAAAEHLGWLPFHGLAYGGEGPPEAPPPHRILVSLGFFLAAIVITALMTTAIARMLRRRIRDLAEATRKVAVLNERLEALYAMTQAIATRQRLDDVLHIVTLELTGVLEVQATSIKLLEEHGTRLRYAAEHGLPPGWTEGKTVEVAKSPIHRRIIEGEPFVTGQVERSETFQFGEDLTAAGIRSVLFVPLMTDDRVIGILGSYCNEPDHFGKGDVEFFLLAADLVAMAVENARAYEAVERAGEQRARFMRQAAHNLRAPVAAVTSMVEVLREGYLGELNETQDEQLRRMERRVKSMLTLINELLTLASSQQVLPSDVAETIELALLAQRLDRTFRPQAVEREQTLSIQVDDGLPAVLGNPTLVEQMLENLISNAIKYTPTAGRVDVAFAAGERGWVRLEVRDTGIGIPEKDRPSLFTEFFRASNAKAFEQMGTGLGLAIVKEVSESMGGRVEVSSTEGEGTTFVVHLPGVKRSTEQSMIP